MQPLEIKYLILGILSLGFFADKVLDYLNIMRPIPRVPKTLEEYVSAENLAKAKEYQWTNYRFGLITGTVAFLVTFLLIISGAFGILDHWLSALIPNPILLSIVFFGIVFIGSDMLSIPFDYYQTFVIEDKYGFNKTTRKTYFLDKIKG